MRLKVVSDGTPDGSYVVDAATNERVENVLLIDMKISAQGVTGKIVFTSLNVEMNFSVPPMIGGADSSRLEPFLTHTRSCPQLTPANDDPCTCGLVERQRARDNKS